MSCNDWRLHGVEVFTLGDEDGRVDDGTLLLNAGMGHELVLIFNNK